MQTLSLGPMMWKDMRVNAWTRNANRQDQKIKQLYKVSALCLDDHQFKNEDWKQLETCQTLVTNRLELLIF